MTASSPGPEKWAMIPESLIVGELLPGISSQQQASALRLYCYLDLRQGANGWPVKGFRTVAKAIGMQPRTVSMAAKNLETAGLIELTVTAPVPTSAVMRVIHNPARSRVNSDVALGTPAKRDRHDKSAYNGSNPLARVTHQAVARAARVETPTPSALHAPHPRSLRSERYEPDRVVLSGSDELRCDACGGLTRFVKDAPGDDCCSCPFLSQVAAR